VPAYTAVELWHVALEETPLPKFYIRLLLIFNLSLCLSCLSYRSTTVISVSGSVRFSGVPQISLMARIYKIWYSLYIATKN
jgi:hypothetical protein